jgi:structure-specific recognition protein 1
MPVKHLLMHTRSNGGHAAVKANFGAMEGYIFFLDKSMLFISKNPLFLPYADISEVRFERVSGALTSSARTFDLIVQMKVGRNEHTFSAVAKDEQSVIEDYLKRDKKLTVKNVIEENLNAVNSELVAAMMEEDSDDDDAPRRPAADDDDEESVDEDFKAPGSDDDDDVAEEFNEVGEIHPNLCLLVLNNHSPQDYSGSDSGSSDSDDSGDDDEGDDDAMEEDSSPAKPAKKKSKPHADEPAKKKQKKASD